MATTQSIGGVLVAVALNGRSPLDHLGSAHEWFLVQLGVAPLAGTVGQAILRLCLAKYRLSLWSWRLQPQCSFEVATEGTQPRSNWDEFRLIFTGTSTAGICRGFLALETHEIS